MLALSHPSGKGDDIESNRRLGHLGDKVLGLIIAEAVYEKNPDFKEGMMTGIESQIVRTSSLATHANARDLGKHLRTSYTEARSADSSLAGAFQALVAAIERDGGLDAARDFVLREFTTDLSSMNRPNVPENPKTDLQEFLQMHSGSKPTYKEISQSGPEHDKAFICAAMCGDIELARGTGRNKKEAEVDAARKALEELKAKQRPPLIWRWTPRGNAAAPDCPRTSPRR